MIKFILLVLILIVVGYLYEEYKRKDKNDQRRQEQDLISQFLLNEGNPSDFFKDNKKPILWIPLEYTINARNWPSFYSRNTYDLNQQYILLCIQTIVNNCSDSFKIALIDDSSYQKLVPGCQALTTMPEPVKTTARSIAQAKLLYYFGGMIVPPSFICHKNLIDMYNSGVQDKGVFVVDGRNKNITADLSLTLPNSRFMGSVKQNPIIKDMILYVDGQIKRDYTDTIVFLGQVDRWCYKQVLEENMSLVSSNKIGVTDANNNLVAIESLMGEDYINFSDDYVGILLPQEEILNRTSYGFFPRLSYEQIAKSNIITCKHLLTNL